MAFALAYLGTLAAGCFLAWLRFGPNSRRVTLGDEATRAWLALAEEHQADRATLADLRDTVATLAAEAGLRKR